MAVVFRRTAVMPNAKNNFTMNTKLAITILILLFYYFGQAQDIFQKVYSEKNDDCQSIQPTLDGGYILAGTTSASTSYWNMYLMKINSSGEILWTKTYGDTMYTMGTFAQQTSDGGYIACGYNQPGMAGQYKICVVKTDPSGNIQWSKKIGGQFFNSYKAYQAKQTSDGGFVICGSSTIGYGYSAAFLLKTNSLGDTLWTKSFLGNRGSYGYCVEQTTDGGYILAGEISDSLSTEVRDVLLVKTDPFGDILWTKTFGGVNHDIAYAIKQTLDGGYIIAGQTRSFGAGLDDVFITKTDILGNPIWTKTYGGTNYDRGRSIELTQDGGYIVAGYTNSFGYNSFNYYLFKTNENGDLLWAKSYGSSLSDAASCVIKSGDGGYIVSGSSNGFDTYGIYLVKTDTNGNSGCNENNTNTIVTSQNSLLSNLNIYTYSGCSISIPTMDTGSLGSDSTLCYTFGTVENDFLSNEISIFPNPFSLEASIKTNDSYKNATLTLYNSFGQQVKQIKNISGSTITLLRGNLSSGLYIIRLTQDNKTYIIDKIVITD